MPSRAYEFAATLYRVGMNYCVDVPAPGSRSWSGEKKVPVELRAADATTQTTALRVR